MKGLVFAPVSPLPKGRLAKEYLDFVLGHARGHAGRWPHRHTSPDSIRWWVLKEMAKPDAQSIVAVAESDPNAIAGCAVVRPGLLVYAYVKETGLRLKGIAAAMMGHLGMKPGQPLAVTVWTAYASQIAAKGRWCLYPALPPEKAKEACETEENPK